MLFEVIPPIVADVTADPDWMAGYAQAAERLGFAGIVVPEHVAWVLADESTYTHDGLRAVTGPTTQFPDPIELLSFLAGVTSTLTLATGVAVVTNHHPVVWAKRVATLSALSKGRVRMGLGVGWNADEMRLCGQEFHNRGSRMDEQLQIARILWSGTKDEGASFHGKHYSFDNVFCNPKPVGGTIPLHIGGASTAAAVRAGRFGDGFQPLNLEGDELAAKVARMRAAARDADRDPDRLELTLRRAMTAVTPESLAADTAAGVSRIVLNGGTSPDLAQQVAELEEFAGRLGLVGA